MEDSKMPAVVYLSKILNIHQGSWVLSDIQALYKFENEGADGHYHLYPDGNYIFTSDSFEM